MVVVVAAVGLVGCATAARKKMDEGAMWRRVDCREEGTAETSQESNLALTICKTRAEAAGEAAAASVPSGRGTADAIAAGIQMGQTRVKVGDNIMISCMAERGYLLRTNAEHEAACPTPPPPTPSAKPKRASAQ
ncbi:hypothetical protein [Rhodovulum sp. PH10]|uniref:hypothetical protein n=1 Tax=Rhodovulum sp. PH10 TaxID=1187851 RepID=UPI0012FC13FF|nr:hypothetical protein [Rhodovulum sp. PH10]